VKKQDAITALRALHNEVKRAQVSKETVEEMDYAITGMIERINNTKNETGLAMIRIRTQIETIMGIWVNIKRLQVA
jgi:hypothetical protein